MTEGRVYALLGALLILVMLYFKLIGDITSKRTAIKENQVEVHLNSKGADDGKSKSKKAHIWSIVKKNVNKRGSRALETLSSISKRAKSSLKGRRTRRRQITQSPPGLFKSSSKKSPHIFQPIANINLTPEQLARIRTEYEKPVLQSKELRAMGDEVRFPLSEHLLYRYFSSCGWQDKFYGLSIAESAELSIRWRKSFGMQRLNEAARGPLRHLVAKEFVYQKGMDQGHRAVLYFKIRKFAGGATASSDDYLQVLMHSIEKANTLSERGAQASGQFVAVCDLRGMSIENMPPLGTMKDAIGLLKRHYPYRMYKLYIVNSGLFFTTIWRVLRPFVPLTAQRKISILTAAEMATVMAEDMGKDYLEMEYGGTQHNGIEDLDAYLKD